MNTSCHECGVETADNEVVCHACGASLDPLPINADGEVLAAPAAVSLGDIHEDAEPPLEVKKNTNDLVEPVPGVTQGGRTSGGDAASEGKRAGLKTLSEGTVLNNRYEIVRKVGGGGMGAVYLAQDHNLAGVQRAVKEMVQSSIEEEQQR